MGEPVAVDGQQHRHGPPRPAPRAPLWPVAAVGEPPPPPRRLVEREQLGESAAGMGGMRQRSPRTPSAQGAGSRPSAAAVPAQLDTVQVDCGDGGQRPGGAGSAAPAAPPGLRAGDPGGGRAAAARSGPFRRADRRRPDGRHQPVPHRLLPAFHRPPGSPHPPHPRPQRGAVGDERGLAAGQRRPAGRGPGVPGAPGRRVRRPRPPAAGDRRGGQPRRRRRGRLPRPGPGLRRRHRGPGPPRRRLRQDRWPIPTTRPPPLSG